MFEDVLVPTDGSDCAEAAVGYAEDLAKRYGSTVHTLCVVDSRDLDNTPHLDEVKSQRTELVERTCAELVDAGITTEHDVRMGVPHREILEYSNDHGIDLVVMGTHGRTGVERFILGSVTEKVVRLSDVPVLTVNSSADGPVTYPYSNILVPTDGSDRSTAAVPTAIDIARTYDARLHAISVVDTMAMGTDVRSTTILDALEETAESAVDAVEEQATAASVSNVDTTVEYGSPYRKIRSYVDSHDIDLVVMGTHGRGGIERYLLGSTTEKMVRTSPVPVMSVRYAE